MQLPVYVLQAVDLRRDSDTSADRSIILNKLTIPAIKLAKAGHSPGGSVLSVDVTLPRLEKIEPAFSVKGVDTDVFTGFGETDRWTFAGAYRNKRTGVSVPGRCIVEGAVTSWEPDETDPEDFQGCSHAITEVSHFEFYLDGIELIYADVYERILRFKGKDLWAPIREALGR